MEPFQLIISFITNSLTSKLKMKGIRQDRWRLCKIWGHNETEQVNFGSISRFFVDLDVKKYSNFPEFKICLLQEKLELNCVYDGKIMELMRCIRSQASGLITGTVQHAIVHLFLLHPVTVVLNLASSGADRLCLSRILFLPIPDLGSKNSIKREGWKKIGVVPFFVATNFT